MAKRTQDYQHHYIEQRINDPYLDRRSGDDRRQVYSLTYFDGGGPERRAYAERRKSPERRAGYTRISPWTSVGPIS